MAKVGNRVKESTDTTGTGTLDLNGAATGFRAFSDEFSSSDQVEYLIVDDPENPTDYEYGIGTFTAGTPDTLSRDTVQGSSNSGNKVSWAAGTKTVICTPLASRLTEFTGDDGSSPSPGKLGLVPAPVSGDKSKFLGGDGNWNAAARIATGSYTGDGATSLAITGLGFAPKFVWINQRQTSSGSATVSVFTHSAIIDDNANGGAIKIVAAGTQTFEADAIIALGSDGFTVDDAGTNAHPNVSGTVYNFVAIG